MKNYLAAFLILCPLWFGCSKADSTATAAQTPKPATAPDSEITFTLNAEQQKSPLIKTETVKTEPLEIGLDALGSIASDTDRVTQIRPPSEGRVTALLASVGDQVQPSQQLVRYQAGGKESVLTATKSGAVLGIYAEVGDYVDPVMPLVTLGDTQTLRCVLDVFEKDIGKVQKGQDVLIRTAAYPDETFKGKIVYISPRVDEDTRTLKVRADIDNQSGKLKFGMFVNGKIRVAVRPAISIPETAIETIDGKTVVFVFKDAVTLSSHPVLVGEKIDGHVEIKSGLKDGDRIVSEGSFILKNEVTKAKAEDNG